MLEDIKIRVTNKLATDNIITHSLNLGYSVDINEQLIKHLWDADYLILNTNQNMRWCDKDIFDCYDYQEMTSEQFLKYREG